MQRAWRTQALQWQPKAVIQSKMTRATSSSLGIFQSCHLPLNSKCPGRSLPFVVWKNRSPLGLFTLMIWKPMSSQPLKALGLPHSKSFQQFWIWQLSYIAISINPHQNPVLCPHIGTLSSSILLVPPSPFSLGVSLWQTLWFNPRNSHNLRVCYVFLFIAFFALKWCDKWVLHRQKKSPETQIRRLGMLYAE